MDELNEIAAEEIEDAALKAAKEAVKEVGGELAYEKTLREKWQAKAATLDTENGQLNALTAGCEIHIHYAMGNIYNSFYRFALHVDERGFQTFAEGSDRTCRIHLDDYSAFLKDTDKGKDWTGHETLVHGVYCNRAVPALSLVHVIADRAGLTDNDIDCCLLDKEVPYVKFTGSVWEELSQLATAAKAHLECTKDKVLP